ncbi:MAG TPA: 3-phosphoshikimate 1-carboxyvinyltransferase [Bacteroidales bacterium]|nr:3-phosphoshikimate 1-carboxyvinyltransferase [Bacteroidales bacterium]
MQYIVRKSKQNLDIRVNLPSSKSISNRLLIMSALSDSRMIIDNLSDSDDTVIMNKVVHSDGEVKDVGHAGTAMRFLTAYYALVPGEVILTGTERMQNRPVGELVDRLRELGARIEYTGKEGYPPLKISGGHMKGGHITIDSSVSSQFISALLMIGPCLDGGLRLSLTGDTISSSYIRLTTGLMQRAGIDVHWSENSIYIPRGSYRPGHYFCEPDWSSASYLFEVVSIAKKTRIFFPDLTGESLQGDSSLPSLFRAFDVEPLFTPEGLLIKCCAGKTNYFSFDFRENPDLVQTIIPVCVAHEIPFEITGTKTLRIKETDRISALSVELKKFDVELQFDATGDWIAWDGKTRPNWHKNTVIETYKDHRMAMGMAPLSILTQGLIINDPLVVSKSYPGYWNDLKKAGFDIKRIQA